MEEKKATTNSEQKKKFKKPYKKKPAKKKPATKKRRRKWMQTIVCQSEYGSPKEEDNHNKTPKIRNAYYQIKWC